MTTPTKLTTIRCNRKNCRGTIIDEDGERYCLLCRRPYRTWRDFGRVGGLQTVLLHGRDYMAEIGRRGGLARRLPTIVELRQQSALAVQSQDKGGRLPNRLSELKELWKEKRGEFGCKTLPRKE